MEVCQRQRNAQKCLLNDSHGAAPYCAPERIDSQAIDVLCWAVRRQEIRLNVKFLVFFALSLLASSIASYLSVCTANWLYSAISSSTSRKQLSDIVHKGIK